MNYVLFLVRRFVLYVLQKGYILKVWVLYSTEVLDKLVVYILGRSSILSS